MKTIKKTVFLSVFLSLFFGFISPHFLQRNNQYSTSIVFATTVDDKVDNILRRDSVTNRSGDQLPIGNFKKEIIPQAIKMLLALVGTISFAVFVYAGIMLIIAQGNEEEITKFKNMLIWSAVGLAFITTSYAIVTGVMQIAFK